jgi:mercuric ion binding protein
MNKLLAVIALTIISIPVWAASRIVTLSVPSMDCQVCPITVKKTLSNVNGVSDTTVNFDKRQAIVTFDDTKTNVDELTNATRNAGYPSVLAENTK